jgi:NAD-dependent deacetylase
VVADADFADAVAALLRRAGRVLFITGAGISADSGLPTYRGTGGLYNGRLTRSGMAIEEVLSGTTFARTPELTWEYLLEIERHCRGALPNPAHHAIAELGATREVTVLTQNIDGLHRAAGTRDLIEIHGTLYRLLCLGCGAATEVDDYAELDLPPTCRDCGQLLRPDVVLFGEALPRDALYALQQALLDGPDLIVSIGTSSVFPYIAEPIFYGRENGIATVEINPDDTQISGFVDLAWRAGAAEAMSAVMDRLAD